MVVGDLGVAELADPQARLQKRLRQSDTDVNVGTANYRPPDVHLGSQRYQEDIDIWSFGCVAAELYLRKPLILPAETAPATLLEEQNKTFVDAIAWIVGNPDQEDAWWLDELPFFKKWYGQGAQKASSSSSYVFQPRPLECLEGCPEGLVQLVQKCLAWHPSARTTIARAITHSFLQPPGQLPMNVRLAMEPGKNGVGTILEIKIDPDLLHYLQECDSWQRLAEIHRKKGETTCKCVRADEARLRLKSEFPGIVDEENPPKCRSLNSDKNLQLLQSVRFAAFVRAIRKKWRPWLLQLGGKMREAVRADGMPARIFEVNGKPIMDEDFAARNFEIREK